MMNRKPIVVVGSINIDLVAKAERIPVNGETVLGTDFQTHAGGKGANQAVAVARLGYPVSMIGRLGSDSFGTELREHLQSAGIDVSAVQTSEGSSGVAVIIVSPSGDNIIVPTPGANAALSPADIDANLGMIRAAGLVLTQLEIPMETVEHLANVCAREGVALILDPAPARELPSSVIDQSRWFTPNETEAAFYSSGDLSDPPGKIAQTLLAKGSQAIVLKLGARGVYLADRNGLHQKIDAFPVRAVDTTAAGDAFNGAFATALMLGATPAVSARFAAAAAAISVTRSGAQPSMPTLAEVQQMLNGEIV
ncbi:MAG TPA: ribokinase [Silvibacterium sp.]|nr:ribokinase [Silvibacterium sp.]